MDVLIPVALQELAVEGSEGCTLTKLWSLIQNAAAEVNIEANIDLAGRPKQFLWQELLKVPGMVLSLPEEVTLTASDPRVQHVELAERLGVHLVAPETLRDSSLGLYDLKVCDARLSREQRDILERIAKSRTKGITQSQLSKEFKVAGNKIFYLVKMLEVRGLVVRQTTLVRTGESKTPIVATNLLHLTRYAKDLTLSSHQRFEILKKSKEDGVEVGDSVCEDGDGDDMRAKTKDGDCVIKDDFPAMEEICQKLEETEGKVLVVGDLKGSLGYRKAAGHRNWRRLIKRLQDAGVVEVFNAQIDRKVRPCVRLLKSFDVKALSGANEELESENTLKGEKITEMVMELSIDQQIYHLVDQSGSDGVQMMEVFNRLGLQNKRNYCRVATMLARQCLVSEAENHKRSTLYRLKTVDSANDATAETLAPVPRDVIRHVSPEVPASVQTSGSAKDDSLVQGEQSASGLSMTVTEIKQPGTKSRSNRKKPESAQDVGGRNGRDKTTEELMSLNKDVLASEKESGALNPGVDDGRIQSFTSSPHVNVTSTRTTQHHSGIQVSTTTRAQREQRILEKLQAEKFVLRVELHRWLEELENRKDTMMDRKTLSRILQAFQRGGVCKCVLLSMPGLTNCGRQRTVEVVLLPSITVDEEVLNKVHEKVRKFDMDCRGHGQSRVKRKDEVPVLEGVKRMFSSITKKQRTTKFDSVNDGTCSMQANGFIPAKMVRVSMLHHFLWSYANSLSHESEVPGGSETSDGMVGSCRIFALANAIQRMPLELFLQIIGSIYKVENIAKWCKQGLRLCDLPKEAFSLFMDTNATGRLSWLVDVLRRLKLVRLVMGCRAGVQNDQQEIRNSSLSAVLTYAMESEPYLEEPAPSPLPSFGFDNYDTSPRARHEFSIATKDGLDAYWQTLEYFYSGAQPALARHAFPGSSVPELFGLRSWTSLRVMSTEQRSELLKRIGAGGIDKRKSAQECAQIAKDLNLSLEQVLGVSYEKNRICRLQTLAKAGQGQVSRKRTMMSGSLAEPSHVKAYKKQRQSELLVRVDEMKMENKKEKTKPAADDDGPPHQEEEDDDDDEDEDEDEGNQNDFSFVANLKPSRQRSRRFIWSERLDRLLITAYVKQRAQLGAGYPRVDWNTMEQLPAPPAACRRRMGQFRQDLVVRKALLSLCALIAARHVKHTESRRAQAGATTDCTTSSAAFDSDTLPKCLMDVGEDMYPKNQVAAAGQREAENIGHDYSWDDMSEPFCAAALDEIIRCKNVAKAKASATKRSAPSGTRNTRAARLESVQEPDYDAEQVFDIVGPNTVDSLPQSVSDLVRGQPAFATTRAVSRLAPALPYPQTDSSRFSAMDARDCTVVDEDTIHLGGTAPARFIAAAVPTRRIRKSMPKIMRKASVVSDLTTEQQIRNSVGVANAIEIVKLVLLNSINEKELNGPLVDAVQRFKEAEVFTAVKYLREQGLLMAGQGAQTFVLSHKFFHDCSASRFPFGTGDQWRTTAQWLKDHSVKMEEDWVSLPAQQQAGQLSHLLTIVSMGEFAFNPSLPAKDIGEVEEKTTRRHASQRPSSIQGEDGHDETSKIHLSVSASWARERRERGFPGVEVSLMRSSRSLPDILSEYGTSSTKTLRVLPESTPWDHDFQAYSPNVPEQTGAITPVDDTHAPGMCGGKVSSTYSANSGNDLQQDYDDMLELSSLYHDKPDGVDRQHLLEFTDPSIASSLAEDGSEKTRHHMRENSVMGSIGDYTVTEKCGAEDLIAPAQSTVDVGGRSRTVNDYHLILSTSRADVRDVLKTCREQIVDETERSTTADLLEDMVSVERSERLPTSGPKRETERSGRSLVALGDNLAPAEIYSVSGHGNTGGSTAKTWALEKCAPFFSDMKSDVGIECARHLNPELLQVAYRAIERAGEEGLTLEMLQADLQSNSLDAGGDLPYVTDYVEALESFSLVKKVNAFDHVRVLEISQSKRFHLNIVPDDITRKRRFSNRSDTVDTANRQPKSFSSNAIEVAGGSEESSEASRRRIDHPSGSAAGSSRVGEHRVISLRSNDGDDEELDNCLELVSVVPWLNRHGALHASMLKSLTRKVMGIVALHPGTPEDTLIEQLNVLNPQSARQLLQLLEADGYLFSRPVMQPKPEAPSLLKGVLKERFSSKESRYVNHYFSDPMSGGWL